MPNNQTHQNNFSHTVYKGLLSALETPNAIKLVRSKPQMRAKEYRQEIIEKVWILSLDQTIESFAAAISDKSTTLQSAIKWDHYFCRRYEVRRKMPPKAKPRQIRKAINKKGVRPANAWVEDDEKEVEESLGFGDLIPKKGKKTL